LGELENRLGNVAPLRSFCNPRRAEVPIEEASYVLAPDGHARAHFEQFSRGRVCSGKACKLMLRIPYLTWIGIVGLALLPAGVTLASTDNSPDTTAKFLAGLAVPATPADSAAGTDRWLVHSAELDRAWKRTDQQLAAIASWAPAFLGQAYQENGNMFYMFSGPDFLYAHALFPNARTYILCGNEPVGAVPDLNTVPPETLPAVLANLRKSLESVLSWSFFITKDMKTDLTRTELTGTLPLLYVFLARTGYTIDSVTAVSVDRSGTLSANSSGETSGVRIEITAPTGASQTLYYFCSDLSDDGIHSKPGFLRFCENEGRGVSLLKAASYLLHENGFSKIRDFLLERSDSLVQDDSGIPLRFFTGQSWSLRFCGQYVGPIDVFKQYWQPDLADQYARTVPEGLPFGFGYRWQPNRSDLIVASRADRQTTRLLAPGQAGDTSRR